MTALEGGPTHIEIQARWSGTPADFTLSKLNGRLKLMVNRGQLLNVDNRIGRIFGLLSIEGLRRRLSLDFNDLFKQGFSFDKLEGSFAIEKGYAYTNNLSMIGPSARIHISGRTGLVNQDYDQLVTVTPALSSSLLTAGAFFGPVGAGVGATMLLAQQVFTSLPDRIDWVLQRQYTVTGSWNDPVVKSLVSQ